MIQWLICFLFGHKVVVKEFTGQQYDAGLHPLDGSPVKGNYYVLRRKDYCIKCGKKEETKDE